MGLLEKIDSPKDLKKLKPEDFPALAAEIREQMNVVSKTGGHLSSNLGVVELTMVLHYLFDTPKDQIVWDTSNQTYTHKLLTGRRKEFPTLRQYEGLSGFAKREESIYDVFNAGHAGTGLSAAVGIAEARDLRKEDYKVICVVGDGPDAGMSYEGLNQAGASKKDLLVISTTTRCPSPRTWARLCLFKPDHHGEFVTRLKAEAKSILRSIPKIGESVIKAVEKWRSRQGLIAPGILFEELGFGIWARSMGITSPISSRRWRTSRTQRPHPGPCYQERPGYGRRAGLGLFPQRTGFYPGAESPGRSRPSVYTAIFTNTLIKLAKEDKRIVAITAAMCDGTGLSKFAKEFPDRYYDVGIAEQHAVTFAAGLAAKGIKPVVCLYSTFLQRAFDQVLHDVCVQNLPVALCIDRGGRWPKTGRRTMGC
jgi:1-deoxy-D-xylulose-5-phosphate synthase